MTKHSQNAAQLSAKAQGHVHDDLRAEGLQKGRGFRDVDPGAGRATRR